MIARRLLRLTVVVAVTLAGAACGSGGDKAKVSPAAAEAQPPAASNTTASTAASTPFPRLEPAAFANRIGHDSAVLIDVHIPYEGELARTDLFIPYDKILADSHLPQDKNTPILLYCRTGHMSAIAGTALHDAGYTNLADLNGGMKAWEASGRELLHNPAHATDSAPPTSMPADHKM